MMGAGGLDNLGAVDRGTFSSQPSWWQLAQTSCWWTPRYGLGTKVLARVHEHTGTHPSRTGRQLLIYMPLHVCLILLRRNLCWRNLCWSHQFWVAPDRPRKPQQAQDRYKLSRKPPYYMIEQALLVRPVAAATNSPEITAQCPSSSPQTSIS